MPPSLDEPPVAIRAAHTVPAPLPVHIFGAPCAARAICTLCVCVLQVAMPQTNPVWLADAQLQALKGEIEKRADGN